MAPVPHFSPPVRFSRAFLGRYDAVGAGARSVTAAELVPDPLPFVQRCRTVGQTARPVTGAVPHPVGPHLAAHVPHGFAHGVGPAERARQLGSFPGPLPAESVLVVLDVAAGISCYKSLGSLLRMTSVRTSRGTHDTADGVLESMTSFANVRRRDNSSRHSRLFTRGWISSPPRSGSQIGRRQSTLPE
jgi:hypothetical protein